MNLKAPSLESTADVLLDWMELRALVDPFRLARIDPLLGALLQQENEEEENIGADDAQRERLIEAIEDEYDERRAHLGASYPFELGAGVEQLELSRIDADTTPYLISLAGSHITRSPLLPKIPDDLITRFRNRVFPHLATAAVSGTVHGPSIALGWPRLQGGTITDTLARAFQLGSGLEPRVPPGRYAPPSAKDGGLDAIGWTDDQRTPPESVMYAQVASGHDWKGKPCTPYVETFEANYIINGRRSNLRMVTIIPHRVFEDLTWMDESMRHGAILDRTRIAAKVTQGRVLRLTGVPIEGVADDNEAVEWIEEFRSFLIQPLVQPPLQPQAGAA